MPKDKRTFITIHDGMPDHPKIIGLAPATKWALIELICYASRNTTDGRVPLAFAKRQGMKAVRELEHAGMIVKDGYDYLVHDYLEHQRSKDEIEELRTKRQAAGSAGGKSKASRVANDVALAKQNDGKALPESETESEGLEVSSPHGAAQKRGHRLPEDWKPSESDIAWQRSEGITDEAARRSTEKFRDHWRAASGQNSRKLDWSAAWKNWLRNDADRSIPAASVAPPRRPSW